MYGSQGNSPSAIMPFAGSSDLVGSGAAVRERAPIDTSLTHLQDRIESLSRLVSALEARFSPACRPMPPATSQTAPPPPLPSLSPVGSLINDYSGSIRQLEIRIESILSSCEL